MEKRRSDDLCQQTIAHGCSGRQDENFSRKFNDMIRDRDRINAHEDYELRYLDKELGVTPEKLKQTVEEVDLLVRDVRKALGN